MATLTLTGTSDQLRRMAQLINAATESATNPRSVTVTLDNGVTGAVGITGGDGKRRDS